MAELRAAKQQEVQKAMDIIQMAKDHLKEQGIDQWQTGYPDRASIEKDVLTGKGFFLVEGEEILGYLCADYEGEAAYKNLQGGWHAPEEYVVVHRMAFSDKARGKGMSSIAFQLVEEMSRQKGIHGFRVDTDEANTKMQHVIKKNGFTYCGKIWFDNSEKIAFDKNI